MATESDQLKRDIEQTRRELAQDVDALTEKVHPKKVAERRVDRAKTAVGSVREKVMGVAGDASDRVSATTSSFGSSGGSSDGSDGPGLGERASDLTGTATQKAKGNPLAAGIIAFGVGWLASSLLPASAKEQQAAQRLTEVAKEHAEPVKAALTDAANEVKENLREPAQQAAESVKGAATEATSTVKEEATAKSTDVTDHARGAGQNVKESSGKA